MLMQRNIMPTKKKNDIQGGQAPRTKEKHEKLMENCIVSTMLTNLSM